MTATVLITRSSSECGELQALLDPCGIALRPYPVLQLDEVDDDAGWTEALQRTAGGVEPAWLVMASPRAPERFVRQARVRGAERLLALPVATVGDGTAAAAAAAGLDPELVGPGTGLGLAEALARRLAGPSTAIFACGHHRRPELPDALAAAGHRVVQVVVYRMRATPASALPAVDSDLAAVVVTSPRAAGLYLEGVGGRPLPCPHWALGPTTRDAARSLGIECRIPDRPTMESLAEELCRT